MALHSKELFASASVNPFPRAKPTMVLTKKFAALAGAPTLAVLTPVGVVTATGLWGPWNNANTPAGTGTIRGFVYPTALTLHATNEVIGTVMVAGEIHHDDVPLYSSETQPNLTAALKLDLGKAGIYVQGITAAY